jgi:hypothetical protein
MCINVTNVPFGESNSKLGPNLKIAFCSILCRKVGPRVARKSAHERRRDISVQLQSSTAPLKVEVLAAVPGMKLFRRSGEVKSILIIIFSSNN